MAHLIKPPYCTFRPSYFKTITYLKINFPTVMINYLIKTKQSNPYFYIIICFGRYEHGFVRDKFTRFRFLFQSTWDLIIHPLRNPTPTGEENKTFPMNNPNRRLELLKIYSRRQWTSDVGIGIANWKKKCAFLSHSLYINMYWKSTHILYQTF